MFPFLPSQCLNLLRQMLLAVNYIHSHDIAPWMPWVLHHLHRWMGLRRSPDETLRISPEKRLKWGSAGGVFTAGHGLLEITHFHEEIHLLMRGSLSRISVLLLKLLVLGIVLRKHFLRFQTILI